jgi:hypothetical protein
MATSVTKGGTKKLSKKLKIVETYRHDHSLESSGGALSDVPLHVDVQFNYFLNFSNKIVPKT